MLSITVRLSRLPTRLTVIRRRESSETRRGRRYDDTSTRGIFADMVNPQFDGIQTTKKVDIDGLEVWWQQVSAGVDILLEQ